MPWKGVTVSRNLRCTHAPEQPAVTWANYVCLKVHLRGLPLEID
jgi:hypothetical protein